jgi:hypothetical protein
MRRLGCFALGILLLQWSPSRPSVAQLAPAPASAPTLLQVESLIVEYERAVAILQHGINENWTREQYLKAFDLPEHPKRAGENLAMRAAIWQTIQWRMPEPEIWDEQPPIGVQAMRLISEFSSQRHLLRQMLIKTQVGSIP